MKDYCLSCFFTIYFLFLFSVPVYSAQGLETVVHGEAIGAAPQTADDNASGTKAVKETGQKKAAEPHPGRDAPLWDKGPRQRGRVPIIRKIREGVFRLGNININKQRGLVSVKGEINMHEGLVEYLACGPRGKLHESVIKLNVEPYYLQIALLLAGLELGNKPLKCQGDPGTPVGDPVEIWITWSGKDKKMVKHRAEDLIWNKVTKKAMKHTHWVFTGSQIVNGRFMAGVEHSIAAVYHDPFAILDHPLPTGADDTLYYVNTEVVPPKGTPIMFVIKSLEQHRLQKARMRGPKHLKNEHINKE